MSSPMCFFRMDATWRRRGADLRRAEKTRGSEELKIVERPHPLQRQAGEFD
jgi:hypothetical protein